MSLSTIIDGFLYTNEPIWIWKDTVPCPYCINGNGPRSMLSIGIDPVTGEVIDNSIFDPCTACGGTGRLKRCPECGGCGGVIQSRKEK